MKKNFDASIINRSLLHTIDNIAFHEIPGSSSTVVNLDSQTYFLWLAHNQVIIRVGKKLKYDNE